ncbi:hypothetical protein [Halalkalicoccus subterraneus]|uniref:hypothetical protein n=1 Tax=Halalkalicoccus subterraneus TaxID=2675002 RepID=UPI000EFB10C2|nr:hypothetical protein [Halalkalicoccus subterraneus]
MVGENTTRTDERVSRHDLLLGLIPSAYAVGLAAQAVLSVSLPAVLVLASLVAATGVLDAVVVHPPA